MGVKTIKALAERMRNEGVQRAVMVTQANMTPFAKQCLSEMAPKYYIELFQEVRWKAKYSSVFVSDVFSVVPGWCPSTTSSCFGRCSDAAAVDAVVDVLHWGSGCSSGGTRKSGAASSLPHSCELAHLVTRPSDTNPNPSPCALG